MRQLIITIVVLTSFQGLAIGQNSFTTTGQLFQIWTVAKNPNDTIKGKRSLGTEERLHLYSEKKELMHELMIAYPDTKKVNRLKKRDKVLKKMEFAEIADSYLWGKLDEYDMLFKPGFEFIDDHKNWIYVKCTQGELERIDLTNKRIEHAKFRFDLEYIGEFDYQKIKGYRLLRCELVPEK